MYEAHSLDIRSGIIRCKIGRLCFHRCRYDLAWPQKTLPAKAPLFLLADTDIFSKAPYRLTASGISDLMGKYTALADWKIAHIVTGEYFCHRIYALEMEVVSEVEGILGQIKSGSEECWKN